MTENATPVPGSPEHDAAMIALAERSGVRLRITDAEGGTTEIPVAPPPQGNIEPPPPPPPASAPRPEWIPEKFWTGNLEESAQKLAASYTALERARSQPPAPQPPATPPEGQPPAEGQQAPSVQAVFDKAAAEFAENQAFSDETLAALEAAGVPRTMADNYVAGLKAQAELVETRIFDAAGGKESYEAMSQWAAANLTDAQLAAYNAAVTSGDMNATVGAIANLKALYTNANGHEPEARVQRQGGSGNEPPAEMYRSKAEFIRDASDQRYLSGDRAWHAMVDRKLAASMQAGIDLGF